MTTALPRLVVAAPASGHGKTTIATGLMAALAGRGLAVSGHKVGPDYIDPGYHALATGRPGRNLDPHLVGEELLAPLLLHGARGADVAVVEGVMGLYDGQLGTDGWSSTAHVAKVLDAPVLLVVDVSHASRSIAAVVHGMRTFDPDVRIAGVVLNKAGSVRHSDEVRRALAQLRPEIPVLGVVHRDDEVEAPSRHLGLVPADERDEAAASLAQLRDRVAERIDLDAVLALARSAPPLAGGAWEPGTVLAELAGPTVTTVTGTHPGTRPVVAMAGGRAFTFRYAETEELLAAAGCDVVTFDPLTATSLPAGTAGIHLGGGFPEVHARDLAANAPLRRAIGAAVASGVPTVAECAGLLYLCRTLDDRPMADVLPAAAAMTPRLTLGYRTAVSATETLLTRSGEQVTGHEFHRTAVTPGAGESPAWSLGGRPEGFASDSVHASYLHVHWAGHPRLALRFARAVHAFAATAAPSCRAAGLDPSTGSGQRRIDHRPAPAPADRAGSDTRALRHHGDVEAADGFLDFAVNVVDEPWPSWLERALLEGVTQARRYPRATPAEEAIARRLGLDPQQVLATAGAAEAFTLLARLRSWRHPVVVHPQFTEPDVALLNAGHRPRHVGLDVAQGFALDPHAVPESADLVVIGNPTNPTGALHPAETIRRLLRPHRLVVVDEAFMDTVPGEPESLAPQGIPGLVVVRSLTKHWALPGIRAGHVIGDASTVAELRDLQTPWSVSSPAISAMVASCSDEACAEAARRARRIVDHREILERGLGALEIPHLPSSASFVLARPGTGVHQALRALGIAVRRADTFPGLDDGWVRIAVREPRSTRRLLDALTACRAPRHTGRDGQTPALGVL